MKLKVGMVRDGFPAVPYWGALEQGLFAQEGLEVDIVLTGGIDRGTDLLLAGDIQIEIGSTEHVIANVDQGGPLRIIAGNVNGMTHSMIVQPDVTKLEDLAGRTVGVLDLNAGATSALFTMMESVGLHYPGDYTIVEAGAVPSRHALLLDGTIDAAVQAHPHDWMAEDVGLGNLGSVTGWIPHFQFASLNCRQDWAATHADELRAFLRAALHGSAWMYTERAGALETAQRHLGIPRRYVDRAWEENMVSRVVPRDLRLVRAGLEACVETSRLAGSHQVPRAQDKGAECYVDPRPLEHAQTDLGIPIAVLA